LSKKIPYIKLNESVGFGTNSSIKIIYVKGISDNITTATMNGNSVASWDPVKGVKITEDPAELKIITLGTVPQYQTISIAGYCDTKGITKDPNRADGNIDGKNNSYEELYFDYEPVIFSAYSGVGFKIATKIDGYNDVIACSGEEINLFNFQASNLHIFSAGVNGDQSGIFTVKYSDGTYTNIIITNSDWCSDEPKYPNEYSALEMGHRHKNVAPGDDIPPGGSVHVFEYKISLNPSKKLKTLMLPNNSNLIIIAITLSGLITTEDSGEFKFAVMADSRGNGYSVNTNILSQLCQKISNHNPIKVFFPGDMINGTCGTYGSYITQFQTWNKTVTNYIPFTNWMVGVGNHETCDSTDGDGEQAFNDNYSYLPNNQLSGYGRSVYYYDYTNCKIPVRFIMLNSDHTNEASIISPNQRAWLEARLQEATNLGYHKIVFFHQPAYPTGHHLGSSLDANPADRDALWQIIDKYNVEVVFCGHEHNYSRRHITSSGSNFCNTIYQVITGGAGAPLNSTYLDASGVDIPPTPVYHYVIGTVDSNIIYFTIYDIDNAIIDKFQVDIEGNYQYSIETIFYVNDDSTNGDVWCTAVGIDEPCRGGSDNPYRTIQYALSDRTFGPGCELRIDKGTYNGGIEILYSGDDTGGLNNYFTIRGAGTNKSIINANCSDSFGIALTNVKWVKIVNLCFKNANDDNVTFNIATNCMISNCLITGGKTGISIKDYSYGNKIVNNEIRNSGECGTAGEAFGIYLKNYSHNNIIAYNWIHDINKSDGDTWGSDGIRITAYSSNNTILSNTICRAGTRGILIQEEFSAIPIYTRIEGNTIYSNNEEGIKIINSGADYTRIVGNEIYGNGNNGNIEMRNTQSCVISNNLIYNCRNTAGEKLGIGLWVVSDSVIWGNKIWGNVLHGIKLTDNGADHNIIKYNIITNNGEFGITLYDAECNKIECNIIKNNGRSGIYINHYSRSNLIKTNFVHNNGYSGDTDQNRCGIFIGNQSDDCIIFRNRVSKNRNDGLRTQDTEGLWVWRPQVINNTFFKNGGRGVLFDNNSKDCTLRNNIAESNTGCGFEKVGTANVSVYQYNNSYGNGGGNYCSVGPGTGDFSHPSDFKSTDPSSSEFLHLTTLSTCVDTGDPADPVPPGGGTRIDRGAIECINILQITKSVSNIIRKGTPSTPLPGATVRYEVYYTNIGKTIVSNIIYDRIPDYAEYVTNSYTTNGGWVCEWSTNYNPVQTYNSADYVNVQPPVSKIKWIRWKKANSPLGDSGKIYFSVIIK